MGMLTFGKLQINTDEIPYILNTNSKKIHDVRAADGRCKIGIMKPECVIMFHTLEEALSYPSPATPLGKPCRFCIR